MLGWSLDLRADLLCYRTRCQFFPPSRCAPRDFRFGPGNCASATPYCQIAWVFRIGWRRSLPALGVPPMARADPHETPLRPRCRAVQVPALASRTRVCPGCARHLLLVRAPCVRRDRSCCNREQESWTYGFLEKAGVPSIVVQVSLSQVALTNSSEPRRSAPDRASASCKCRTTVRRSV